MLPDRLPPSLRRTLTTYRRLLDEAFGARLVDARLFGSFARGDASDESDADVAVVVADLTERERTLAIDLALDAWREAGFDGPIPSPLVWSVRERDDRRAAERRIAVDIEREGVSL